LQQPTQLSISSQWFVEHVSETLEGMFLYNEIKTIKEDSFRLATDAVKYELRAAAAHNTGSLIDQDLLIAAYTQVDRSMPRF